MRSTQAFSRRAKPVSFGFGAVSEALLLLCLLPGILILALIEARRTPRPLQPPLEDRQHRA